MPKGPGKYDDLATLVLESSEALAVAIIIIEGNKGNGFSVQAPREVLLKLPNMLRQMADGMEQDINGREQTTQ